MTTMMNMNAMMNQRHQFPHLSFMPLLDVDVQTAQFAFQEDALANSLELDEDNDEDTANDIDDFTSLLASVEDEEAVKDIDAFTDLIETLSKSQCKEELSDVLMNDLLPVPTFSDHDLDDLFLDAPCDTNNDMEIVEIEDSADESDSDDDESAFASSANVSLSQCHASAFLAPIDPRCCIKTAIFKTIDSRIPMVSIPKMDASFGMCRPAAAFSPVVKPSTPTVAAPVSSIPNLSVAGTEDVEEQAPYVHDPAHCWVCKSGKSEERKMILHRFVEKRYKRNWKRGARYKARSRVASSRVREGGRFVTKCQWFAPSYES